MSPQSRILMSLALILVGLVYVSWGVDGIRNAYQPQLRVVDAPVPPPAPPRKPAPRRASPKGGKS